jgi:transposase
MLTSATPGSASAAEGAQVYLACGSTDLRKSIDGLAALVSHVFGEDLFSHSLFVFCNRGRDKLKILLWDHNGFWLYYRRLEHGRFRWPAPVSAGAGEKTLPVSRRQLQWLLEGLPLEQPQAHRPVRARIAA